MEKINGMFEGAFPEEVKKIKLMQDLYDLILGDINEEEESEADNGNDLD